MATTSVTPVVNVGEEPMTEEQLLTLGRERGYVTLEEIMVVFPEAENDVDRLDEVFTLLMENGIEVGERPEEEPVEAEEEEIADELDEGTLAAIETDDTNPQYLLQLGLAFLKAGRHEEAVLLLEQAAKTGDGCPEAEAALARLRDRKYGEL